MNYNDWKPSRFFVLFRSNFNIVTVSRQMCKLGENGEKVSIET